MKITFPVLLSGLLLCGCSRNQSVPAPLDVSGFYRLDTATLEGHPVPANFYAFSIVLNTSGTFTNGTFIATNVPADFFFDYTPTPAVSEARGTWKVRHTSDGGSLFYTGENDYLDLEFTTPSSLSWSQQIEIYRGIPRFRINYHSQKSDSAWYYLSRQK
jgi:hypothetical protein